VLVSSDGGYVDVVEKLRMQGKRVVVIGEKKVPAALRKSCNKFSEV
jgi:uncharacterized LabA/DUF88 family protein